MKTNTPQTFAKVTTEKATKKDIGLLHTWYLDNKRPLPWRKSKDPYKIWISEIMLQQTTSKAVIPFFERFTKKFPTVNSLAKAKIEDVYEVWSGLGYYSRARNIHKAAKLIVDNKSFPNTYEQLLELPGIGPYTSRAIASIAFSQPVGVLDGNVIRVLSRKHNLAFEWWKTKERNFLQDLSDSYMKGKSPADMNQALMELGATLCKPLNPSCLLCPWLKTCSAQKNNTIEELPLVKPKAAKKILLWTVEIPQKKSTKIVLVKNQYAPFLKNQWLVPGSIKVCKTRPKTYDLKHNITKYDIYVQIKSNSLKQIETKYKNSEIIKTIKADVKKLNPSSVIQKIINL